MTMFKVMMNCRAGTRSLRGNDNNPYWQDDMHTITVLSCATEAEARQEVARLRPIGFNRERATLWVEEG